MILRQNNPRNRLGKKSFCHKIILSRLLSGIVQGLRNALRDKTETKKCSGNMLSGFEIPGGAGNPFPLGDILAMPDILEDRIQIMVELGGVFLP